MARSGLAVVCLAILGLTGTVGQGRDLVSIAGGEGKAPMPEAALAADTVIDPLIDWPVPYGVQNTGLVRAMFGNNATFGAVWSTGPEIPGWPKVSFEVPVGSGTSYLFGGGIWIGGIVNGDTLVSTGQDGWVGLTEFYPDDPSGGVDELHGPGDFAMRAEFTDTNTTLPPPDYEDGYKPHQPLNVRAAQRSYVWRNSPADVAILYDLVVTNIGTEIIQEGYIGFYFDADVCLGCDANQGFTDDVAGSLREHGIGYIIDNDGDFTPEPEVPRAFCFKLLEASVPLPDTSFNWWLSNGSASLDFGPRLRGTAEDPFRDFGNGVLGTPTGDRNKYYIMRHREWDYDQVQTAVMGAGDSIWVPAPFQELANDFADGYDARFLMSFGPFDLVPGQSERFVFATFTTDSVHTIADNGSNLPNNPTAYLANLDFSSVIRNADISDSLAAILMEPQQPPAGLHVVATEGNDITVGWDPSCLDEVTGHLVMFSPVDPSQLPYPGVAPPWLELTQPETEVTVGADVFTFTIEDVPIDRFVLVSAAYVSPGGTGESAHRLIVKAGRRAAASHFDGEYAFVSEGGPVPLAWSTPGLTDVHRYNLYRFDSPEAAQAYHAFYDRGIAAATIEPADTFDVNGVRYYYYAMPVYQTISAVATSFDDVPVAEGTTYIISSVDAAGFESEFSEPIEVIHAPVRDRDVLILTRGSLAGARFQNYPRVTEFYDSLFVGYLYDIYDWGDTNRPYINTDWHLLMKYELVVIDDDLQDVIFRPVWEDTTGAFSKYLLSGGRLAYFGSMAGMTGSNQATGSPLVRPAEHSLLERFFGIDSVRIVPYMYLASALGYPPAYADWLFGFQQADPAALSYPGVEYDLTRGRINPTSSINKLWPTNAPLSVSTFVPKANGEVTHLFGSDPSISSVADGQAVGVYTEVDGAETYAFGFHLWYMELPGARALIDAMLDRGIMATFDPDTVSIIFAWSVHPETLTVHIGNLPTGLSVFDIETGTIRLSGTVEPVSVEYVSGVPGFTGDVLAVHVSAAAVLADLIPIYGYVRVPVAVTGSFAGGDPFTIYAGLVVVGKLAGDYNWDGIVNVADLTIGIDCLFRGGHPELAAVDLDVTGDCSFSIADMTMLISYMFRGGGATLQVCLAP